MGAFSLLSLTGSYSTNIIYIIYCDLITKSSHRKLCKKNYKIFLQHSLQIKRIKRIKRLRLQRAISFISFNSSKDKVFITKLRFLCLYIKLKSYIMKEVNMIYYNSVSYKGRETGVLDLRDANRSGVTSLDLRYKYGI